MSKKRSASLEQMALPGFTPAAAKVPAKNGFVIDKSVSVE